MPIGRIRKLFSGGNTPLGFYSFYDHIIDNDAQRVLIVEGVSGTGRSMFMRKIVDILSEAGIDLELHFNANDNELLDAIVMPQLKIALIDGAIRKSAGLKQTNVVETVLNLDDISDEPNINLNCEEIAENRREIGRLLRRAYDYLAIAKIFDDIELSLLKDGDAIKWPALYAISSEIIFEMFGKRPREFKKGHKRHLFASAFTPYGLVNFLDSIFCDIQNLWILDGPPGSGEEVLIERVIEESMMRGYVVEVFHCPLNPKRIEHVLVSKIGLGIVTSSKYYHYYRRKDARIIDSTSWLDMGKTEKFAVEQEMAHEMSEKCFEQAVSYIRRAKQLQDIMDINMMPGTDFERLDSMVDKLINRCLSSKF